MGTAEGGWNEQVERVSKRKGCEGTPSSFVKSMLEKCVGKICFVLEFPTQIEIVCWNFRVVVETVRQELGKVCWKGMWEKENKLKYGELIILHFEWEFQCLYYNNRLFTRVREIENDIEKSKAI